MPLIKALKIKVDLKDHVMVCFIKSLIGPTGFERINQPHNSHMKHFRS